MQSERMYNLYLLIKDLEEMKNKTSQLLTSDSKQESLADHSWGVSMMAYILAQSEKDLNIGKVIELSIVHDLGKLYDSEYLTEKEDEKQKYKSQLRSIHKIASYLPISSSKKIIDLWKEYNRGESKEAAFVKAINQLETMSQYCNGQNVNDFSGLLSNNIEFTDQFKVTKSFRALLNEEIKYSKKDVADNEVASNDSIYSSHRSSS